MDANEDPDDIPVLSGATLNALQEFFLDRDAHEKLLADLKSAKDGPQNASLTMEAFAENWNESQFWYSQKTATTLANQLLVDSNRDTTIAVISAPSVFVQLKNLLANGEENRIETPRVHLLEFDERFSVFPEFIHYDFRDPLRLPAALKGTVDRIICDPPFLSEECQTKAALTARWLSKSRGLDEPISKGASNEDTSTSKSRLIVCTGERMEGLIKRLYCLEGIATTTFMPEHAKGLSNEFYCYANFECGDWKWRG